MLAINGGDLIRAGVKPGPELGQLLNSALDAVIEDNIPNDREALLVHLNLNWLPSLPACSITCRQFFGNLEFLLALTFFVP